MVPFYFPCWVIAVTLIIVWCNAIRELWQSIWLILNHKVNFTWKSQTSYSCVALHEKGGGVGAILQLDLFVDTIVHFTILKTLWEIHLKGLLEGRITLSVIKWSRFLRNWKYHWGMCHRGNVSQGNVLFKVNK